MCFSTHDGGAERVPYTSGSGESEEKNEGVTLPDYIYMTYDELLRAGWRMHEIDIMDMPGFLRLRAWTIRREKAKEAPKKYIDEIWPKGWE